MPYTADDLLFRCINEDKPGVFVKISAEQAKWDYLNMVGMRLEKGKTFGITIDQYEYAAVILNGVCDIRTNKGNFTDVGFRRDVFGGLPHAIYMPRNTEFEIEARTDMVEIAMCWAATDKDHPIKLIMPEDARSQIIGQANASYQLNTIIGPGFAAHRLLIQELYLPGGNWGLYPPFKHDTHRTTPKGEILETYLEKICLYRFNRPGGYAMQRIYAEDDSVSAVVLPQHHDAVIVPKGYHPVAAAPGYPAYALLMLAGSAHAILPTPDPEDAWLLELSGQPDARLPLVDRGMHPRH